MLIATIAAYLQPFIMGIGVEKISDSTKTIAEKSSELNIIVILLIATTIITMVAQSFQRYNIGFIGQNILLDLRVNLFKHFNKLSMSPSSLLTKCKANLSAVLFPIPGSFDISSTAFDNNFEERSIV